MKELHYSDILLIPKYSELRSRSYASIKTKFLGHTFNAPFFPANMKTIINEELARQLADMHYFYIMHRFGINTPEFVRRMKDRNLLTSISVGVNNDSYEVLKKIEENGDQPDFITIDIAHGWSIHMKEMIKYIKDHFDTKVIAGNVCTAKAAAELVEWGADSVKIGVGPGHACTTKLMTGFSRPQFTAVYNCSRVNAPMIADGGIEHNGDIAKALVAGAAMVCCGHLLAGFDESPGDTIIAQDGRRFKEYYGSASEHNKEMKKHVEGKRLEIPLKGSIWNKYTEIEESLKSSISYAGGQDLNAFKNIDWVIQ